MINVRLWWSYGDRAGISLWSCWDRTRIVLRSYCDRIMIITLWSAQIPHTTITFQVFAISFANSRDSLSVALLSRTPNDMMPFLVFLLIKTLKISLAGNSCRALWFWILRTSWVLSSHPPERFNASVLSHCITWVQLWKMFKPKDV